MDDLIQYLDSEIFSRVWIIVPDEESCSEMMDALYNLSILRAKYPDRNHVTIVLEKNSPFPHSSEPYFVNENSGVVVQQNEFSECVYHYEK